MKKILFSLLCGVMVLGLSTGCGKQTTELTPNNNNTNTENSSKEEQKEPTINLENWGVDEWTTGEVNYNGQGAYIKFPKHTGITEGPGIVANQGDGTLVIFGGEKTGKSPELPSDRVEDILPAYFEMAVKIVKDWRAGLFYSDFEFTVKSKETVTINDYEMVKCTGEHSYKYDGELRILNYVAYATRLKGNGAVVYWVVFDESEDQSLGKTIEEYAKNMAYTLHE